MPSVYYPPSDKLSKYIATYFLIESQDLPDCGISLTVYPNGHIIMGIAYGKILPVITDQGVTFAVPNMGVSGRYKHPVSIRFFDPRILITIFKPFGFYYIFGIPEGLLLNQTIALEKLGIGGGEKVVNEIAKSKSVNDKIDCLENWLIKNLTNNNVVPAGLTEYLMNKIIQSQGTRPLKDVLLDLRVNPRYIERHFSEHLGTGAKELSKIIRFSYTANYLIHHPATSTLELCEIGHFYDPSHLIKEFNKYTGYTPSRFIEKIHNDGSIQFESLTWLNLSGNII